MDRSILFVGLGGLIGSVARYLVSVALAVYGPWAFPLATFLVNIIGCFIIGILFGLTDRAQLISPEWRLFLTTGFCGGFTTFSTFSYESVRLMQDGEFLYVGLNVGLSVIVGFAATYLGIMLIRWA